MTEVFDIQLPDGRIVGIQANSPQEAAQGAKNILAREKGSGDAKNYDQGLSQAVGQGAAMGYGDELTAAIRSALPGLSNWMMKPSAFEESLGAKGQTVSNAPTYGARYDEELNRERSKEKAFAESNPVSSVAGHLAGNVATGVLAAPVMPAMGPGIVGNVLKTAAAGGALGGVQGFGEGEDGVVNRLTHALISGGLGAAGGALVPILGAAGRQVAESPVGKYVGEKVVAPAARMLGDVVGSPAAARSVSAAAPDGSAGMPSVFQNIAQSASNTPQRGAVERIANAMQREGMTTEQIVAKLEQLGPEGVLADVGPQFLSEARRANTLPGETKTVARNVLEGRDRQAGNRLTAAFEGNEPPPSAYALRGEGQAFDQNLRAVGNRVYDEMDAAGLKQSPELMALYENPKVSAAITKVMNEEKATRIGTSRTPASPVDIMHKVKQEIQDMGVSETGRGSSTQSYYRDLAGEYVRALKSANPKLAEADAAYAQAASLPEHFDVGAALLAREGTSEPALEKSAARLADMLATADPQQKLAARTGATNAARNQAQESTALARALARRVDESAPVQSKIRQLYEPGHASDILRQAGAEKTFANTSNEILRGSKTADKIAEALDTGNAGIRATTSGTRVGFYERLKDLPEMLVKPNEGVRNEIGRLTLSMNSEENRRILALAAELLKKRQQGIPISTAIGSSAAGEIAR